jgi:hypothetical protein
MTMMVLLLEPLQKVLTRYERRGAGKENHHILLK